MAIAIRITLNERLYLRDPQETELGRKIIKYGILLIDELGFEEFTFKKLAVYMGSTEASVYRYFVNKHLFLLYLVSWYWEWVTYLLNVNLMNVEDASRKIKIILSTLVFASKEFPTIDYVNESVLHRIVISEGAKAYHTKEVDAENQEGLFHNYKKLVEKIANVILEVQGTFPYPQAMASNLVEMSNNHIYFAKHLPGLTNVRIVNEDYSEIESMLEFFAFQLLNIPQK